MFRQIVDLKFLCHKIRIIIDPNGGIWFSLDDVCRVLDVEDQVQSGDEIKGGNLVLISVCDHDERYVMVVADEALVYYLSHLSGAECVESFVKWISEYVLPTLRGKGWYDLEQDSLSQFEQKKFT